MNIQSPTEFASQQLNADTWRDETLVAVITASFLFWQQYHDSTDGGTYCRYYLSDSSARLPHIGVLDPLTGQLVKSWTGFKDAERLMDKLMEYADRPPCPPHTTATEQMQQSVLPPGRSSVTSGTHAAASARSGTADHAAFAAGDLGEDAALPTTFATSPTDRIAPECAAASPLLPTLASAPHGPTCTEEDNIWGPSPSVVEEGTRGSILIKVRLPEGQFTRRFLPEHTLRDVLRAIHHESGSTLAPSKSYKLAAPYSEPMTEYDSTLAQLKAGGVYNLTTL